MEDNVDKKIFREMIEEYFPKLKGWRGLLGFPIHSGIAHENIELKDIPYKLIESEEVPNTPLMRNFLYTFEFCRRRYVITDDLDFNIAGHYFDNDKFLFLLRHNFGIRVNHDADWTLESIRMCAKETKFLLLRAKIA